ncbi:MAG: M23 family metallopeptidase [Candidatus Eremiobacterota bacterium]
MQYILFMCNKYICVIIIAYLIISLCAPASSEPENLQDLYYRKLHDCRKTDTKLKARLAGARLKLLQLSHIRSEPVTKVTITSVSPLTDYLNLTRKYFPLAEVTGRFQDWRTTSKYRRRAGLHYGYDIYLEKGTKIPVLWDGIVTDVINWYGEEYGVTVMSSGGLYLTYGHVRPVVEPGQKVSRGDIIALCWSDHVDLKLRDSAGNFVDFAKFIGVTKKLPPITYEKEKKIAACHIFLIESLVHLNIAEAYMEYIKTMSSYYSVTMAGLSEEERFFTGKDSKKYREEIDYIRSLKEIFAENFRVRQKKISSIAGLVEKHIALAREKQKKSEVFLYTSEVKITFKALQEKMNKVKADFKPVKEKFHPAPVSDVTLRFPPEYIVHVKTTGGTSGNDKSLMEARNNLSAAFELYIQGIITEEKLDNFRWNYRKVLMKNRVDNY